MVSTYSPNIQLEEPARGDQVGTWDTPVNNNMTLIDLVVGGRTSISLNNSPVTLSAAQFQCKTITFNSTLTGSVAITFPSTFTKSYEIYHTCTGSSAFVITLQTTVAGGQVVCPPPGEITEVINDGTNIRFKNLGRVGSYWDYAGSSVPSWVSGCTVPPYLNCDASTFSATTYPQLAVILGSTTLPDRRGNHGITLNQGTARLTVANGFMDGDVRGIKTTQVTLGTSNMPAYTPAGTNSGGTVAFGYGVNSFGAGANSGVNIIFPNPASGFPVTGVAMTTNQTFTGTPQGGVSNTVQVGSVYVYGICMIRAA